MIKLCPGDFVLSRNGDILIVDGSTTGGYEVSSQDGWSVRFNHDAHTLKNKANAPEFDIMIVLDGSQHLGTLKKLFIICKTLQKNLIPTKLNFGEMM